MVTEEQVAVTEVKIACFFFFAFLCSFFLSLANLPCWLISWQAFA